MTNVTGKSVSNEALMWSVDVAKDLKGNTGTYDGHVMPVALTTAHRVTVLEHRRPECGKFLFSTNWGASCGYVRI